MLRASLVLASGIALGFALGAAARWGARADDGQSKTAAASSEKTRPSAAPKAGRVRFLRPAIGTKADAPTVQEAMLLPCALDFDRDTPLQTVADELRQLLAAPVALDPAALKRQKLTPDSTVRFKIEGVRLKVALGLLLEQAGLTWRIEPEDNLLVLTDEAGSGTPHDRLMSEVRDLHRDVHDLQDAVEEVYQAVAPDEEGGEVRKPTIIEEVPEKKPEKTPPRTRPG